MRTGRDVRIAALDQRPELPPGPVLAAVEGEAEHAWEAAAVLDHLGMAALRRRRHRHAVGRPGQAGGAGPHPRGRQRPAGARRADQPPRHRRHRLARGPPGRLPGRAHARHPRPPPARPGHHPGARARPGPGLRPRRRLRRLPRGPGRARGAGRGRRSRTRRILARKELAWLRRGAPARTRKPKARIESATAIVESRAEPAARQGILDLRFGTPRLGDKVVELHDVGHRPRRAPIRCSTASSCCSTPASDSGSSAPTASASRRCST